jgi:hypothetical protein
VPDYLELRLRIEPGDSGGFNVFVSGPGGEASGRMALPFAGLELENFVLRLSRARSGVRRVGSPETDLARDFGGRLFGALFQGKTHSIYLASRAEASAERKGLRLSLDLTQVPELLNVPWEYLYDDPYFLSQSVWTPVVRYLDLPRGRRPVGVTLPLRILGMVSSPTDLPTLDTDKERANLEVALQSLSERGLVDIEWVTDARLGVLLKALQRAEAGGRPFHVFHYCGHGGYDPERDQGFLLLEDEFGRSDQVDGERLATILHDTSMSLAVLNACEGGRSSTEDPFAGVACSLVEQEIPAVIAMQFEITDEAAIIFAENFYGALADNLPIDAAMAQARKAIFAAKNDVEWGTPVLFMRVSDGRVFDVHADPVPSGAVTARSAARLTPAESPRLTITLDPVDLHAERGGETTCEVSVGWAGQVGEQVVLDVSGTAAPWSRLEPRTLDVRTVIAPMRATIRFRPPRSLTIPPGPALFTVRATARDVAGVSASAGGQLEVDPASLPPVHLPPGPSLRDTGARLVRRVPKGALVALPLLAVLIAIAVFLAGRGGSPPVAVSRPHSVLLYSSASGTGESGQLSDQGYTRRQPSHLLFAQSQIPVPSAALVVRTGADVFFYDPSGGAAALGSFDDAGSMAFRSVGNAGPGWTAIASAGSRLLFYRKADGATAVGAVDGAGRLSLGSTGLQSPGWTHVVSAGDTLVFYNADRPTPTYTATIAANGALQFRSPEENQTIGLSVVSSATKVLFYNVGNGELNTWSVTPTGLKYPKADRYPGYTDLVAAGNDVLFYNRNTGAAAAGPIGDDDHVHAAQLSTPLTPGWTNLVAAPE